MAWNYLRTLPEAEAVQKIKFVDHPRSRQHLPHPAHIVPPTPHHVLPGMGSSTLTHAMHTSCGIRTMRP